MTNLPQAIGRFEVRAVLGKGAMGVVYRAHDPDIDRTVAIKLIRADLLDGAERTQYLGRFHTEMRAAGRCQHPRIVGLHDAAMHEGNPYLVMEYVDGRDLGRAYKRGARLEAALAGRIALQALDALAYAHGLGIVHRDVKPANLLLANALDRGAPGLKMTDFGISRLAAPDATRNSAMVGTPSYMSPEQCRGELVDQRCDLFSLGCVLHELLGGARTFAGASYAETIYRLVHEPHRPLLELRPDLPAAVGEVMDRALAKRPEERFANARDMAAALSAALGQLTAGAAYADDASAAPAPGRAAQPASVGVAIPGTLDCLDPATLSTIERLLAHHLGPIAGFQLRQAIRQARSVDGLHRELDALLPNGDQDDLGLRSALAAALRSGAYGEAEASDAGLGAEPGWRARLSDETVQRATRALAGYMGPIALHLASAALSRASSRQEFEALCAAAIERDPERDQFLALVSKLP